MTQNRHYASVLRLQHVLKCACFTSFYVGSSSEIRTFRSQIHVFYVWNMSHNVCLKSQKNITETSLRNVLNVPIFVFNTSCNVSVTRCLRRKKRHNASVLRLQHALKCACFTSFYVGNSSEIRTFSLANACLLRFEHVS